MATIKKTNIYNYLKSKFSNTASHIKMNGTQSAGSSDLIARADHVHPTDTSRAAANHTHNYLAPENISNLLRSKAHRQRSRSFLPLCDLQIAVYQKKPLCKHYSFMISSILLYTTVCWISSGLL